MHYQSPLSNTARSAYGLPKKQASVSSDDFVDGMFGRGANTVPMVLNTACGSRIADLVEKMFKILHENMRPIGYIQVNNDEHYKFLLFNGQLRADYHYKEDANGEIHQFWQLFAENERGGFTSIDYKDHELHAKLRSYLNSWTEKDAKVIWH